MSKSKRKYIDCREFPNEIDCTLTISGSEKEVLKAAVRHAIEEHGHQDTPELKKQLKALMQNEPSDNDRKIKKIVIRKAV
jgi:predicted small metal-binding protein